MRALYCFVALATLVFCADAGACHGKLFHRGASASSGCGSASASQGCASGSCSAGPSSFGSPGSSCPGGVCPIPGSRPILQATLVVSLPSDAKLTIDGNVTASTGSTRTFSTPLPGQSGTYTLEARIGGQVVVRQVTVRAGEETAVTLEMPTAVASR